MSANNYMSVDVKFGDWISEGFRMFTEQWQAWVLQTLVMIVVLMCLMIVEFLGFFAVAAVLGSTLGDPSAVLIVVLLPAFMSLSMIASSGLICGMFKSAFKQLQGGKVEVADLFSGMDRFLQALLAQVCVGVLVFVGFLFCIIPGFLLAGLFYFTLPLIIHGRLGVIDAMKASAELAKRNILMFTLFAFVVGLLSQIGAYACYVGLLATFPLQFTIGVVAYRDCFGVPGARTFQPPPPQFNPGAYGVPPGWTPPSAVPPQMVLCRSCQTPIPPGAQFCPRCGGGTA